MSSPYCSQRNSSGLVDAGPREVAAHGEVRPVAHAQVHTAHLGHRAQQLGERSLAHRQIHLAEVGFIAPGQRVEPGADRLDPFRRVGRKRSCSTRWKMNHAEKRQQNGEKTEVLHNRIGCVWVI